MLAKAKELVWFIDIMKVKMLKHPEDPNKKTFPEIFNWLQDEVNELKDALQCGSKAEIILECADVANIVYFIARKIKKELIGPCLKGRL